MAGFFVDTGTQFREENLVTPLINGKETWESIHAAIISASRSIWMSFWMMEADLELLRPVADQFAAPSRRQRHTLFSLLERKRQQGLSIKILIWAIPAISPFHALLTNREILQAGILGNFEVMYQPHPSSIGSWHQKFMIIDEEVAYVGGMNAKGLDWDTLDHNALEVRRADFSMSAADRRALPTARDHSLTNQPRRDYMARIQGPIVYDVTQNFIERWHHCITERENFFIHARRITPRSRPGNVGPMPAQISRTMPDYPGTPGGETGIKDTYIAAIRAAEEYIYIEDQYFRSATIATELATAMRRNPRLIVIVVCPPDQLSQIDPDPTSFAIGSLSSYWTHAAYQTLRAVRSNFVLFFFQTTYTNRSGNVVYVPINIHSKIMLVDDIWYTIGSCNVNDRGFDTEGELNVSVKHSSARDFRIRIFENILGVTCPPNMRQATRLWFEHTRRNNRSWSANTAAGSKVFSFGQRGPLLPALPQDWT